MMTDWHVIIPILISVLAAGGQVFNYVLHLRILNAIMQSEEKMREWVHQNYVPRETFAALCKGRGGLAREV